MRWPGGCFADSYNWRDGIGPRKDRPRRTNFWRDNSGNRASQAYRQLETGPQKYDPNWFGTNEFMRFCKLTGAQPYFAANLRSLPAKDFYEWVEYCNAPAGATTLSDMRAAAGDRDPFNVEFWGIGNESWGCGGSFTPEEYSTGIPPFHRLGAALRRQAQVHRRGAQRRRHRLDARLLHQHGSPKARTS